MRYVFKFLPINDIIENVVSVNKNFYKQSKFRVKLNPEEVILLQNTFTRIKRFRLVMLKKRANRRKRFSSWRAKIRNPDERIIF